LRGNSMRYWLAASLLACSTAAIAQTGAAAKAERDLLEKVVEIPTVQFRGQVPRMVQLLSVELRKAGVTDIIVKDHEGRPGDKTQTMVARWHAQNPTQKPIVLMAHMDVVDAKAADWKNDPFTFRELDGYYLGRGVSDDKAGVVAIVSALQRLKASGFQPNRDIIVLFTGDEENAGNGVRLAASDWGLLRAPTSPSTSMTAAAGCTRTAGSRAAICRSPKRPMPTSLSPPPIAAATARRRAPTMPFISWRRR
jgi:hypothetical protein